MTRNDFIKLLDKGYTNQQLALHFETSVTTIKRRKKMFDLVGYKTNSKPLTDKELQELEVLASKGYGYVKACQQIGKAGATVRKYIPKNLHAKLNSNGRVSLREAHRKATFQPMLKPSELSAYILGYLVADGTISGEGAISAVSKDLELIKLAASFFGANVISYSNKENRLYYTFTAKDHRFLEQFKQVTNLKPRKTYEEYIIPEWVYDYLDSFIVGLFNGDGWAYSLPSRKNSCELGIEMHQNQARFLESISIYLGWNFYEKPGKARISTKQHEAVNSFAHIFCNSPYSLSRKAEILLRYSLAARETSQVSLGT